MISPSDPTTLSPEERVAFINSVRLHVLDHTPVTDEELAFAIKCIAINRATASRATKPKPAKPEQVNVSLDDL